MRFISDIFCSYGQDSLYPQQSSRLVRRRLFKLSTSRILFCRRLEGLTVRRGLAAACPCPNLGAAVTVVPDLNDLPSISETTHPPPGQPVSSDPRRRYPYRTLSLSITDPFSPAGSFDPVIATPWSSPAPTMGARQPRTRASGRCSRPSPHQRQRLSSPAPTMGARQPRTPASGRCSRPGPVPGARIWSLGLKSFQIRFSGLGSGGHSRGLGSGRVRSRHDFAIGDGPPRASCSAGRLC